MDRPRWIAFRAASQSMRCTVRIGSPTTCSQVPLTAILGAVRCTPAEQEAGLYLLQSLCVARGQRRRGLGRALLAAAVADLGEGARCYLHASEDLVPLYAAAGFREVEARAGGGGEAGARGDAEEDAAPRWMRAEHEAVAVRLRKRGGGELVLMTKSS